MKFLKTTVLMTLLFAILLSVTTFADVREINEFGIKELNFPEGYISCGTNYCDEELKNLLEINNYSVDSWRSDVMEPNNFFIYACNLKNTSECIYLICEEVASPKSRNGNIAHRLAADYNLLSGGEEMAAFLDEKRRVADIDDIKWNTQINDTPFIEYFIYLDRNYYHRYETVYNGYKIILQFTATEDFTNKQKEMHNEAFTSIKFSEKADYTEINGLIADAVQKELEAETHSGENTKIIRIILVASIPIVIVFAIFMAIRTQSRKRRRIAVGIHTHQSNTDTDKLKNN